KDWRASIVQFAFEAMRAANRAPFSEPLILKVGSVRPPPRSHYRSGRNAGTLKESAPTAHSSRPDIDKLLRQLSDSLTNVVWTDDALVCQHHALNRYGEHPGAKVTITPWAEEELLRDGLKLEMDRRCDPAQSC